MLEQRTQIMEERYRRALRWGLVVSVILHVAVFLVFDDASLPTSPFSAAGERRGDARAAWGGGMEAVELSAPAAAEDEPVPAVEPQAVVVEEAEEDEEEVEEADEPVPEPEVLEVGAFAATLADVLSAPGPVSPLTGTGLAEGEGEGDGGTEAEGLFRGVVPPQPRGLLQPPADRPERLRGREVEIWVYVSAAGRVVEDSTRLNPPTGDRRFDRRLRDRAADWVFEAARRDGIPVGEWYRYTIVM